MTRAIDLGSVNGQLIVTDNDIEEITQNANDNIVSKLRQSSMLFTVTKAIAI